MRGRLTRARAVVAGLLAFGFVALAVSPAYAGNVQGSADSYIVQYDYEWPYGSSPQQIKGALEVLGYDYYEGRSVVCLWAYGDSSLNSAFYDGSFYFQARGSGQGGMRPLTGSVVGDPGEVIYASASTTTRIQTTAEESLHDLTAVCGARFSDWGASPEARLYLMPVYEAPGDRAYLWDIDIRVYPPDIVQGLPMLGTPPTHEELRCPTFGAPLCDPSDFIPGDGGDDGDDGSGNDGSGPGWHPELPNWWDQLLTGVGGILDRLDNLPSAIADALASYFGGLADRLDDILSGLGTVSSWLSSLFDGMSSIDSYLRQMRDDLMGAIGGLGESLIDSIEAFMSSVEALLMPDLGDFVDDAFSSAGDTWDGSSMAGVVDGFTDALPDEADMGTGCAHTVTILDDWAQNDVTILDTCEGGWAEVLPQVTWWMSSLAVGVAAFFAFRQLVSSFFGVLRGL